MGDLFFFTDVDLLNDTGSPGAQDTPDAFGPQTISAFRLNSKHKSNSTAAPHAYAVARGFILIHKIPGDSLHVNLILKPSDQPAGNGGIGLPRIKYIIYRNVLKNSLIVGSNPESFVPAGSIGMVDKIRKTYKFTPAAEVPLSNFLTSGTHADPIDEDFAFMTLPLIDAGLSIGLFDPAGFGVEILLDDLGFDPDMDFASRNYDGESLCVVNAGSGSPADDFSVRAAKEYVLHFLDPCAFYGNLYLTGLKAKKSDGSDFEVNGKKQIKGDDLYQILKKFKNHDRAYVDIRNENNHSFNYYRFVNDATGRDFYSIYTDTFDVDFINAGGSQSAPANDYYGAHGWPLFIVDNQRFSGGNTKEKNIVSLKLPKGNNPNPTLFVSVGIRNEGGVDDPLKLKKSNSGPAFVTLEHANASYGPFELVIPNNKVAGATTIIPTYTRLKYFRRIAFADPFAPPVATDVQFLDNLFPPLAMKNKLDGSANLEDSVYEVEQYVDLTNADQFGGAEYVGNVGISFSEKVVTLFCYPLIEHRKGSSRRSKKFSVTTSRSDSAKEFIEKFGASRGQQSPFVVEALNVGNVQPKVVYYKRGGGLFPSLKDDDYDNVLMLVLDKGNFNNKILAILNDSTPANPFSPGFDVRLVLKAQSHRDLNFQNDADESAPPRAFAKCLLYLKGFKLENGNVQVVEEDTGIRLYAKREEPFLIYPILKDIDAVLDLKPPTLMPSDNIGFLIEENGAAQPILPPASIINHADFNVQFANLGKYLNNLYNEDLINFIETLYAHAGDDTSKRLYQHVFSKFIKTQSTTDDRGLFPPAPAADQVQLNFVNGKISHGAGYLHPGMMLEGANYFALWKATENLKKIAELLLFNLIFVTQSSSTAAEYEARFRERYDFVVGSYPPLNNMIESLKSAGIRPPTEVLEADKKNSILITDIKHDFMSIFLHDRTGASLRDLIKIYYNQHDKAHEKVITYERLLDALTRLGSAKQDYVSQLSRTIYKGLDNTLSNYDFLNVAIGDGSDTAALFGGGDGKFLFNYSFEPKPVVLLRTKRILKIDNRLIDHTNDYPYAIHFGIYGMNGSPINHKIIIERAGKSVQGEDPVTGQPTAAFTLVVDGTSFRSDKTSLPGVGWWDNVTKDLIIEQPKTRGFTSLSLVLDSHEDEEAFCIALYKTVSPMSMNYAKSFENLFADDCFQLTPARSSSLWLPHENELLEGLIEVLKSDPVLKLELMHGGGVGKYRLPGSFPQFDETAIYTEGALVVHEGQLYKSLARVMPGDFKYSQWILQPAVEADPNYVFNPPASNSPSDPWHRVKEEKLNKPLPGTQEDLDDARLRYSYASIIYDTLTQQLIFRVESYASSLISNLHLQQPVTFDGLNLTSGLSSNQWLCLSGATIQKQNPNSQAQVKDEHGVVVSDSYNQLLSSLRSCGLLHALLERIKLAAFDMNDSNTYSLVAGKLDAFRDSAEVEVTLTRDGPGVIKKTLSLATFLKIINNNCP